MEKISFIGNGWIEFHSTEPFFEKITSETNKRLIFHEKEKILIFHDMKIQESDVSDSIYIGTIDVKIFLLVKLSDIKKIVISGEDSQKETVWYNKDTYKKENSTLCGNKFLGEYLVIANLEDSAFGEILERRCKNCFFQPKEKNSKMCNIITGKGNRRPRTLFRRRKNEVMQSIVDEKEVAQYCPYFTHWDAE